MHLPIVAPAHIANCSAPYSPAMRYLNIPDAAVNVSGGSISIMLFPINDHDMIPDPVNIACNAANIRIIGIDFPVDRKLSFHKRAQVKMNIYIVSNKADSVLCGGALHVFRGGI